MSIPVAINRSVAFLAPNAGAEGQAALRGILKLSMRREGWISVPARDAAVVLTNAEQGVLLRSGARFIVRFGAKVFLVGAVLDFARRLISGSGETPSLATRLEIIESHVIKGGPLWTRAIGVSEQVLFILLDAAGETMADVLAGALSTFDTPGQTTALPPFLQGNSYYAELATPVADLDAVDSIFEVTPAILLQPALVPFPVSAETFPAGPRPSFGRRS